MVISRRGGWDCKSLSEGGMSFMYFIQTEVVFWTVSMEAMPMRSILSLVEGWDTIDWVVDVYVALCLGIKCIVPVVRVMLRCSSSPYYGY